MYYACEMKKYFACLLAVFSFLHISAQSVPSLVNYQGRLLDAAGNPRSGNVSIELTVHTAATGGSQVYTETLGPVPVNNGLFALQFGGQPGFAEALANPEAWLEVRVDGIVVGPRSRLVAVPYALKAASVETVTLGNITNPTPAAGTIRWTGSAFEGFNGTAWIPLSQHPPLVNIEMVTVGNPGNAADISITTSLGNSGSVSYTYQIGKYEVTNTEYCTFLNAVDRKGRNILELYEPIWAIDDINGGIILIAGNDDGFKYVVKEGFDSKPVLLVTVFDAMRFCNWLHNGALVGGDTENGAYSLMGNSATPSNGATVTRNANAKFALPSENEWYKAAYYQPSDQGGDFDGYWFLPTRSNMSAVDAEPPGNAFSANFSNVLGFATPVGSYSSTIGFYGTFDMAGNVSEWTDTIFGVGARVLRGGSFESSLIDFGANSPVASNGAVLDVNYGFRIVSP